MAIEIEPIEPWKFMTKEIERETIDRLDIDYPRNLIPQHAEFFEFSLYDLGWIQFYEKVASRTTIDKGLERSEKQKQIDNFYGLMGEKAVKDKLREMRVIFNYNEREPHFFEKPYKEPFDFAIATKNGKYVTLEIKTTKEYPKHMRMMIPESEWKKSDYVIAIKMLKFERTKRRKIIGYGAFVGCMGKEEIEALPLHEKGDYPCLWFPCRAIELKDILHPVSELWEIIDSKAIKWKP